MYFVDVSSLKRDLAADRLSQFEVALYLVLGGGVSIPIWYPASTNPSEPFPELFSQLALDVCSLAISVVGVVAAYRANGGLDGKRFAERYLSLSWVVGVRLGLVALPLLFGSIYLAEEFSDSILEGSFLVFEIVFFWRLVTHVRDIRSAQSHAA